MRTRGKKKGKNLNEKSEVTWAGGKEKDWCAFASCLAPVVVEMVVSLVLTRGLARGSERPEQK
jgi:hypothetical protein